MLSKIVSLALVSVAAGQFSVVGSPEWQAYKQAELAHIAPSPGPRPDLGNYAQAQLDWQHANNVHQQQALAFVSGHGRRKRQVQVEGSPEWQAWKNAELAHIAPSIGPLVPGVAGNWAQQQLNHQQAALNFVAGHGGR